VRAHRRTIADARNVLRQPTRRAVVTSNGELRAFVPGCFADSLRSGKTIQFRLQHEAANVVATTRDNLTIVDDPKVGLTFRLRVPGTMIGQIVASMVQKESRTNMSIGYSILDDVVRNIAGHQVRLITEADLLELSLVKEGAIRRAFAMIVDGARTAPPRPGSMSLDFKLSSIAHNLNLAAKDYRAMMGLDADASGEVTA